MSQKNDLHLIPTLKTYIRFCLRKMGMFSYTHPQTYTINYAAHITNKSETIQNGALVLPLPLETDYQKITQASHFSEEQVKIRSDASLHNLYGLWHFRLRSGETKKINQQFTVKIFPRRVHIAKNQSLHDYTRDDKKNCKIFLQENPFIQARQSIRNLSKKIINNETDISIIIKKFNAFVLKFLAYGNLLPGLYSIDTVLQHIHQNKAVDCGGYNVLFASLCLSVGIPARIVSGFWVSRTSNNSIQSLEHEAMHSWVEVYLPQGEWVPLDPSVEQLYQHHRTLKYAALGFTGSDRVALSYGCHIPISFEQEKFHADILQNPVVLPANLCDAVSISTYIHSCAHT